MVSIIKKHYYLLMMVCLGIASGSNLIAMAPALASQSAVSECPLIGHDNIVLTKLTQPTLHRLTPCKLPPHLEERVKGVLTSNAQEAWLFNIEKKIIIKALIENNTKALEKFFTYKEHKKRLKDVFELAVKSKILLDVHLLIDYDESLSKKSLRLRSFCIEIWSNDRSLNTPDSEGKTLLHHAANDGLHRVVDCLLIAEMGVDVRDGMHRTALHYACQAHGQGKVVDYQRTIDVLMNADPDYLVYDYNRLLPLDLMVDKNFSEEYITSIDELTKEAQDEFITEKKRHAILYQSTINALATRQQASS